MTRSLITIEGNSVALSTSGESISGPTVELTLTTALTDSTTNLTVALAVGAVEDAAGNGNLSGSATTVITAEAQSSGGICDRSPAIQEAIMFRLGGLDSCSDATLAHIGNIETLHISRELGTLRSGDLVGLSSLKSLTIYGTNLHPIESGAFAPRRRRWLRPSRTLRPRSMVG